MRTKYHPLFLALLLPYTVLSQIQLTQEQVLEDYTILKNVLVKGHPSLYDYTSKTEWDSLFVNFEKEKIKTVRSNNDFYKKVIELTDYVRDGHLIIMRPQLDSIPNLFPIWLKIINKKLYTDTDDFNIPVGSEIISIDEIKGTELRERFLKYVPSDGFNTTKKDRQIEREFGILHFYEFGTKPTYKVEYKTPNNQVITKTIKSQSFESIGKRFSKRNSHFAKNALSKKEPFVRYIDSLNAAVLTLNTFGLNQGKFQSELKEIFKKIKRKRIKQLVIDIRQNDGGYPENSNYTFSYIAKKAFIQPKSQHVITSKLPHKEHSQEIINGYTYKSFFEKYFRNGSKTESEWVIYSPENKGSMVPRKKRFEGQVYVLIGGNTFSAGSTFALNCKNQGITLIGEETGGGYYSQTGGYPVVYTLPNSKIKMMMSFVKAKKHIKDKTVKKGTGVMPDIEIKLTTQDLIELRDRQLIYALKQIKK
ncbi:S41 family peptidase [Tenacibaculum xiamenense]|uniref:S41 family peptidase n=1 Tax=Tenacibaculum xiamenense TaxID=1261553 RepID=UPI003893B1A4